MRFAEVTWLPSSFRSMTWTRRASRSGARPWFRSFRLPVLLHSSPAIQGSPAGCGPIQTGRDRQLHVALPLHHRARSGCSGPGNRPYTLLNIAHILASAASGFPRRVGRFAKSLGWRQETIGFAPDLSILAQSGAAYRTARFTTSGGAASSNLRRSGARLRPPGTAAGRYAIH